MPSEAVNEIIRQSASGIPQLYEWGGLVTLLLMLVITLMFALFGMGWVVWQMYKQNQIMFKDTLESKNKMTHAVEILTEWIKGRQST